MMSQSLMGDGTHLLDDDICHVSQRDFATCMASRQARHDLVNRARGIAFGKTFNVFQTLSGIVPPSPRGDEAQTLRRARILSMAQTIFGTAVNEDQLQDIIARMRYSLAPSSPIRFAQRLDSNCTGNAHYVVNMTQPLALCPEFFTLSEEERVRVFLRGSAQMTRVDASIPVALCADNACDTACGGFNAADTWAKFVWCASAI